MAANKDGSIVLSTEVDQAGVKSGLSSITSMVKEAGKALAAAFSVKLIFDYTRAASEAYKAQMQAEVKLATVLKQRTKATNDQIKSVLSLTKAQQKLGVIGDEVQIAGAQQLATFINQTETLETLIPAMNNLIAQQRGYDATTGDAVNIANLFGKAMMGQASALRRVGITFDEAQENVLKYGTEEEKAATLAQVVTQNVGEMNAALASTTVGKQKQLANTMGDVKEQFGQAINEIKTAFLPILRVLAGWFSNVAHYASVAARAISEFFGLETANEGSEWEQVNAISSAAEAQGELTSEIEETEKAQKGMLAGFDQLNTLSTESASNQTIGGTATAGTVVTTTDVKNYTALSEKFAPIIEGFKKLKDAIAPFKKRIGEGLKWLFDEVLSPLARWAMDTAIPAVIDLISAAFEFLDEVIEAAEPAFTWIWENFFVPIGEWIWEAIIGFVNLLTDAFKGLTDWARENPEVVSTIAELILGFLAGLWVYNTGKKIVDFIVLLGTKFGNLSSVFTTAGLAASFAKIGFALLLGAILLIAQNWDKMSPSQRVIAVLGAVAIAAAAAAAAVGALQSAWSLGIAAAAIIAGTAAIAISVSSAKADAEKDYQNVDAGDVKLNVPEELQTIPKMAKGGVVPHATYALIGEAGKEAVLPLESNTEWMDVLAVKLAKVVGRQKDNRPIVLEVNGREIARATRDGENSLGSNIVSGDFVNAY